MRRDNMEVKEEILQILQKVWIKIHGLPQANALELGAFLILVIFIATFLSMFVVSCIHCCCCAEAKYKATRIRPIHAV